MLKKLSALSIVFSVFLLYGCAARPTMGGSVDYNVRSYEELSQSPAKKTVNYYCNFDRIARQDFNALGDYCSKANNQDYVSYFVPFDIQSTTGFDSYLIHNVSEINSNNKNYKYYQIYSNNNLTRLSQFDFDIAPPTSFAIMLDNNSYAIAITKRDLLARTTVYPGLYIHSLAPDNGTTGDQIGDYTVTFSIPPYSYKIKYNDSTIGRMLGLPDYTNLTGALDAKRKADLKAYNDALNSYWKSPEKYKYSPAKITAIDYAIPQLGVNKFKNPSMPSDLILRVQSPQNEEKLANQYLPFYELRSIDIIQVSGSTESVLKTFTGDDIAKVLISFDDNPALIYKGNVSDARLVIRYNHEVVRPQMLGLQKYYSELLGIGYIYSDIAPKIETNLAIERYYPLEKLPTDCIDVKKLTDTLNNKGVKKESIDRLVSRLSKERMRSCTMDQKSIGDILPALY